MQGMLQDVGENTKRHHIENFKIVYKQNKRAQCGIIDAEYFAISLAGFCAYQKFIAKKLFDIDLRIEISKTRPGSFEAFVYFFSQKDVVATAVCISFLQFLKIDISTILRLPVAIFRLVCKLIKESKGNYEDIIHMINDLDVDEDIKKLLIETVQNKKSKSGLDHFTAALDKKEIVEVQIQRDQEIEISISQKDRKYFEFQDENSEELVSYDEYDCTVRVVYNSPYKTRWRFSKLKQNKKKIIYKEFWAEILVPQFINLMKDKTIAEIGDVHFNAHVIERKIKKIGGIIPRTEYSITAISEISPQLKLPFFVPNEI